MEPPDSMSKDMLSPQDLQKLKILESKFHAKDGEGIVLITEQHN